MITPHLRLISEKFVLKLMESLEHIQDDDTHKSLISILVCLVPVFEQKSEDTSKWETNIILKEFNGENEDTYKARLMEIMNLGSFYRLDKCCKVINIILHKPDLANEYFYTNQMNNIMDICLREI